MENIKEKRLRVGKLAGIVGIAANILLFAVKVIIGIFTGSIAAVADAINNLSDAGSSVFVLVGYHLSGKPADKEHPYGHARMEYLCGLFISVIITVLGIELLRDSAAKLFGGGSVTEFSLIAIITMAVTMLGKAGLAIFNFIMSKKIDSDTLKATAIDSIGDIFATGAVVAGMLLTPVTGKYTDAVLGAAIAVYIIVLGIKLVRESSDTLLGKAPDKELVADIVSKIRSYEGVLGIHDLVVHSYGAGKVFASVHVEVDADGDVMVSHDLCDNIENDFRDGGVVDLVIHMDPVQNSDPKVNALRAEISEILSHIASECGSPASMHDFRAVFGVTHSNLIFDVAITDEFPLSDRQLCDRLEGEIKKLSPIYNTVITVDRDYTSNRFGEKV
ncbi:MAG: cation transporter [Clostridia bacterium]|nr:cation transporter [Clostridia bacterium]